MEIRGIIIAVLDERSGVAKASGKPYRVAQYVLETTEQYPKKMMFEVFGDDKIKQMNIQIGEEMTISFDIDSREYNGKWYNQIRAWKVERQQYSTNNENLPPVDTPPVFPPVSEGEDFPIPLDNDVPPF